MVLHAMAYTMKRAMRIPGFANWWKRSWHRLRRSDLPLFNKTAFPHSLGPSQTSTAFTRARHREAARPVRR